MCLTRWSPRHPATPCCKGKLRGRNFRDSRISEMRNSPKTWRAQRQQSSRAEGRTELKVNGHCSLISRVRRLSLPEKKQLCELYFLLVFCLPLRSSWLGDFKRSGNLQGKKWAFEPVLCLAYQSGMYYGNCCRAFIWYKRVHNPFLLLILVKKREREKERESVQMPGLGENFLIIHQVQLRIFLLCLGNSIVGIWMFLSG